MQLCFAGTVDSGKSTTLTLLHIRANELLLSKKIGYRSLSTEDGGLDLPLLGGFTRRGFRLPATPTLDCIIKAQMQFSFPTLLFKKKELDVTVVDGSGELQYCILRPLPSNGSVEMKQMLHRLGSWGITEDAYEQFINTIFSSDAFLFIINGEMAYTELIQRRPPVPEVERSYLPQEQALANFISNIRLYKELNPSSPPLREFAILLTKVDRIVSVLGENPSPTKLAAFAKKYLYEGWAQLHSLCDARRIEPKFFYQWLHPNDASKTDGGGPHYETDDSTGIVLHPQEQYALIIDWFKGLAYKK